MFRTIIEFTKVQFNLTEMRGLENLQLKSSSGTKVLERARGRLLGNPQGPGRVTMLAKEGSERTSHNRRGMLKTLLRLELEGLKSSKDKAVKSMMIQFQAKERATRVQTVNLPGKAISKSDFKTKPQTRI